MKILTAGSGQNGWSTKKHCTGSGNGMGGCGALLLVEAGDIFHTSSSDHGGGTDHYHTFECTACHVWTDLTGVPSHVMNNAPHRTPTSRRQREGDK